MNLNMPDMFSTLGQITNQPLLEKGAQAFSLATERFDPSNPLGSMLPTASGVFNVFNEGELSRQVDDLMVRLTSGQMKPEDLFGAFEAAGFAPTDFRLAAIVEFLPQVLDGGGNEDLVTSLISMFLQQNQGALGEVLSLLNGREQANEILNRDMSQRQHHPLVPGSGPSIDLLSDMSNPSGIPNLIG